MYGYTREAVRVKVKKCEIDCSPEWRKFSVDPQITSVDVLHSIVAKAFDIRSDFSMFYRTLDPLGHETFLAVLSDWDLDAAFLRTHNYSVQTGSEPCLNLRVDINSISDKNTSDRTFNDTSKIDHTPLQQSIGAGQKYVQNMQNKLPGLIMNHMEKTFSMVQRALNFAEEQIPIYPPRAPLSDSEFRGFLDSVGQIVRPQELRQVIFLGGIEPSLRRVVWKHILNVYPDGMTGKERMDYIKRKATEYCSLRDVWKLALQNGSQDNELAYVTSMVKKDVLRTDRLHQFYAGNDDNKNIASLFNILTTFALNHPKVSYCQGMSDLASPLLVTMNDEAHAYICFCAIMERLQANFMLDGIAMTQKFSHLTEALQYYDSEFYEYLKLQQADDLLFCYRWLLLELKREFPFEDSLRMLEVQWSSLRSDPPDKELKLFDKEFIPQIETYNNVKVSSQNSVGNSGVQRKQRENHYANICALRRQTSSMSLYSNFSNKQPSLDFVIEDITKKKLDSFKRLNHSLDENISRVPLRRMNLMKAHQSLDETKMLLLMRSITPYENLHTTNFDILKNQLNSENKSGNKNYSSDIKNNATKRIIFHSTNPFINEAQGGSTEILVFDDRVDQRNLENILNNITETSPNSENKNINDSLKRNIEINEVSESIISAQILNKHKGHFKELKEKIAASKKGIMSSIDRIETTLEFKPNTGNEDGHKINNTNSIKSQKIVKNFNEFLNFTKNVDLNTAKNLNAQSMDKNYESSKNSLAIGDYINILNKNLPNIKSKLGSPKDSIIIDSQIFSPNQTSKTEGKIDDQDFPKILNYNCTKIKDKNVNDGSQVIDSKCKKLNQQIKLFENINSNEVDNNEQPSKISMDILNYTDLGAYSKDNVNSFLIFRHNENQETIDEEDQCKRISTSSSNNADIFIWENPLHQISRNSTCSLNENEMNENHNNLTIGQENIKNVENILPGNLEPQTILSEQNDLDYTNVSEELANGILRNSKQVIDHKQIISKVILEKPPLNPFLNDIHDNNINISSILSNSNESEETKTNDPIVHVSNEYLTNLASFPSDITAVCDEEIAPNFSINIKSRNFLPPPNEFGGGNPFLIFLCLTLLLQHRNYIMRSNLDYNEMAMHFDKMVRKHDVNRVLNQARRMYFDYVKTHNALATTVTDNSKLNHDKNT